MKRVFYAIIVAFLFQSNSIFSQSPKRLRKEAISFHNQALKEHELGRDSIAYYLTVNALSSLDNCGESNSPLYAECKHDAGMFALMGMNNFDLFSSHLNHAIKLKQLLYGESTDYYWSKECLAEGCAYQAEHEGFPQNIKLLEEAVNLFESIPDYKKMRTYIASLNNLALAYEYVNTEKAISFCEKALEIKKGLNDADSLITLSNLSRFYNDVDYDKALYYAQLVLDIREKNDPSDYVNIRASHYGLASIYGHTKEYDKAITHSEMARCLAEKLYGKQSQEYALSTQNSGTYLFAKGDTLKALDYLTQAYYNPKGNKQSCALNIAGIYSALNEADSCYKYTKEAWHLFTKDFVHTLGKMSLENRFGYACQSINYGQSILPLFYFLQNEEHTDFKKLALNCMLFNKNIIIDCERGDNELNNVSDINFDSIKTYLGENDIAIEYWSDKESLITWEDVIIVSIIRRSYEVPIFVKLSKDKIHNTLNNKYETTKNYLPLYENIWKEIIEKAHIKEGERLFVALDDVLSQIPIESICNYDWDYMGDKYEIVRVSSTSLIPQISQEIEGSSAVLYGGLVYDTTSLSLGNNHKSENRSLIYDNLYSEIGDTIISELRAGTKYLPWTKTETDSIQKILSKSDINKVLLLQGKNGTEESFKLLSDNSPSIIHVSTHGFCIQPSEEMSWYDYYNYCMVHSGLLMSGVFMTNEINRDSLIVDDGFLRSSEIAALDLNNTELLVLSACKTGLGGVTPWGMTGLQRAFKAAGVGTMLVTLGDVDDAATYLMMISFYKFLLSGDSKRTAIRKAQQLLRESELFNSSVYWANFVLID